MYGSSSACVSTNEWIELAVDVDHAVEMLVVEFERIVAAVEELDVCAEQFGSPFGFVLAAGLDLFQSGSRLLPGKLALAALTVRQTNNLDPIAALGMQRDGATSAPNEIAGMGGNDEPGLLSAMRSSFSVPDC